MTALHWLAYNNDRRAIEVMLAYEAYPFSWSHDELMPVDIAGSMPSYGALDGLLENFGETNKLHPPQAHHMKNIRVDKLLLQSNGELEWQKKTIFSNRCSIDDGDEPAVKPRKPMPISLLPEIATGIHD